MSVNFGLPPTAKKDSIKSKKISTLDTKKHKNAVKQSKFKVKATENSFDGQGKKAIKNTTDQSVTKKRPHKTDALPKDLPLEMVPPEPVETSNPDDSQPVPNKKSTLSEVKRKSVKYRERKKKNKIDKLRSTMSKEALNEYLNPTPPEESQQEMACDYVKQWKADRINWKFNKLRQTWLLKNMYDKNLIDEDIFATVLEYIQPLKGAAREATVKQAENLLSELQNSKDEVSIERIKRSTRVLQMFD